MAIHTYFQNQQNTVSTAFERNVQRPNSGHWKRVNKRNLSQVPTRPNSAPTYNRTGVKISVQNFDQFLEQPRDLKLRNQKERELAYHIVTIINEDLKEKTPPLLKREYWETFAREFKLDGSLKSWNVQEWINDSAEKRAILPTDIGTSVLRVYTDYAATALPLNSIQHVVNLLTNFVGNPHADAIAVALFNSSLKGLRGTHNDTGHNYFTITEGAGSTGSMNLALQIINQGIANQKDKPDVAIIRTGLEHNTTKLLPERLLSAGQAKSVQLETIDSQTDTNPSIESLKSLLKKHEGKTVVLTTAAGQNVSSQLGDKWLTQVQKAVNEAKQNGTKVLWIVDAAAYSPHEKFDLSKYSPTAVVMSPHKTVGTGTPGVGFFNVGDYLELYNKPDNPGQLLPPAKPGGGSVEISAQHIVQYQAEHPNGLDNEVLIHKLQEREGSGTPNTAGTLSTYLGYKLLYDQIGREALNLEKQRTKEFFKFAKTFNKQNRDVQMTILGDQNPDNRFSVVSVNFQDKNGNDILSSVELDKILKNYFGIQGRPNCNCSGDAHTVFRGHGKEAIENIAGDVLSGKTPSNFGGFRMDVGLIKQEEFRYILDTLSLVGSNLETYRTAINHDLERQNSQFGLPVRREVSSSGHIYNIVKEKHIKDVLDDQIRRAKARIGLAQLEETRSERSNSSNSRRAKSANAAAPIKHPNPWRPSGRYQSPLKGY